VARLHHRFGQYAKRLGGSLVVAIALQCVCFAEITKLPSEDQQALRKAPQFEQVRSATNLPPSVFARCADSGARLAERGGRWESTDLIEDSTLPTHRLVWAVKHEDYYVVHYERGGRGHSFHLVVAKLSVGETKPGLVWHAVGDRLKDVRAFQAALANHELDDRLDDAR